MSKAKERKAIYSLGTTRGSVNFTGVLVVAVPQPDSSITVDKLTYNDLCLLYSSGSVQLKKGSA
jgi:hypothetical protein